ncbi:hypothetical protein NECAME_08739 [Necator americanus]|uniref:Uncharacterized protein n=1 Tax=Necator americanus TaxID=51031 RepID=W2TJ75_NECAM|nr:hypothetical protein NECAME_08739 [Necator americanus]ETN81077.1 hypothetical protein NECAME_08739 [Necator americanus]
MEKKILLWMRLSNISILNTICPPQALHRVFDVSMQERSHTAYRLPVHLLEYQSVHFIARQERQFLDWAENSYTTLTADLELNRLCENIVNSGMFSEMGINGHDLYYYQIPEHFKFTPRSGWQRLEEERVKKLDKDSGFFDDDTSHRQSQTLSSYGMSFRHRWLYGCVCQPQVHHSFWEAAQFQTTSTLCSFFACLLCYHEIANAEELWTEFSASMADDITNMGIGLKEAIVAAYFDVADRMLLLGRDLTQIVRRPANKLPSLPDVPVDYGQHESEGSRLYGSLNTHKKSC